MILAFNYFRSYFLITTRNVPALFFTLIFPPLLILLFAHQWSGSNDNKLWALVIFLNYSVQTVALMLLGMGVTQEKNSDWAKYLRTLPVSIYPMIMGRILHTLFLSIINLVTISCVALFILHIPAHIDQVLFFSAVALSGGIPMAIMGITIGYAANTESSRSIFTLLNLLLLFGSFSLPDHGFLSLVRDVVPTYQWSLISYSYIDKNINPAFPILWLAGYSLVFLFCLKKIWRKYGS